MTTVEEALQDPLAGVLAYVVQRRGTWSARATVDSRRADTIARLRALGVKVRAARVDYVFKLEELPVSSSECTGGMIAGRA